MLDFLLMLLGCGSAIFLAGFYGGMETAGYGANRLRLRYMAAQGEVRATWATALLKNIARMVTITLIGHNLAVYLGTYIMERYLRMLALDHTEYLATFLLTPFCFIFAETTPKHIGILMADAYCLAGARVMRISRVIFRPIAVFLGGVSFVLRLVLHQLGLTAAHPSRREEVLAHLAMGREEGLLSPMQHQVARHVMKIDRQSVGAVITPFGSLVSAKRSTPCGEILKIMRRTGYQQIPILKKRSRKIYGFVTLEELMRTNPAPETPAEEIMRPAACVEASTTVARALSKLQSAGEKAGVVLAENRAAGIVTIHDFVEELVGNESSDRA